MTTILAPYATITDIDGSPLDAGFVYFGEFGKNPEQFPIETFWDDTFTTPAAQPIRTRNGYIARNGSPAKLFVKQANHSVLIKNQKGSLIVNALHNKSISSAEIARPKGELIEDSLEKIETDLEGKAPLTYVEQGLNQKANAADVYLSSQTYTQYEINTLVEPKADKTYVDTALSNIASGASRLYPTLAAANADIATIRPLTAEDTVRDKVDIAESENGGIWYKFAYNSTSLTKSEHDPLLQANNYTNAKISSDVKDQLLNLDQTDKFYESATTGVFNPDFTTLSAATLSFVGGQAVISQPTSVSFIRSIYTGRQILDNKKRVLNFKFKIEDVSSTSGGAIFIAENIGIVYYSNGAIAVVNKDFQTQSSQAITDSNLAYVANESVELEIQLNGDGSGVAIAKKSNGYNRSLAFTGMQKGKVYLAASRMIANKTFTFESLSVVEKTVTASEVGEALMQGIPRGFDLTVDGFYASTNDAKGSQHVFNINNGKINLDTTGVGSNAVFYAKSGAAYNGAAEFEVSSKILTGTVTAGMCLVVGDGANRKIFAYLKTGLIGTMNATGTLAQGSVVGSMAYENGQTAKMRVAVSEDGDAILTAIHPSGAKSTFKTTGVTTGNVYVGWRGNGTTAEINYLEKVKVSPSSLAIEAKIEQLNTTSKFPKTWKVLPDSEVGRTTKGFTCTGLAKITAGQFRECWAIGDDGRLEEGDSTPFKPRVHILDGAFNRILLTIDPGYTGASLQGVTFDTLTNEHLWAACSGNETIRKFSLVDGLEVVSDRIAVSALGIALTPNAIAFDATRGTGKGAVWVGDSSGNTVYLIDCDPLASTRIIKTITLANNPDQFQLIGNTLLYQSAGNGTRASVYNYNLITDAEFVQWQQMECWFAAEGFFYDQTFRTLYAVNDAGYHNSISSGPRFNCVLQYTVDL